jgi:uncharacterized FlaG/YvyC family protein
VQGPTLKPQYLGQGGAEDAQRSKEITNQGTNLLENLKYEEIKKMSSAGESREQVQLISSTMQNVIATLENSLQFLMKLHRYFMTPIILLLDFIQVK